jgi:hypothetical protein
MPMLPKLEPLIEFVGQQKGTERASPANDEFSWPWLRLLFEKAIRHPNGWIRIWALQRAVRLPPKLYQNNSEVNFIQKAQFSIILIFSSFLTVYCPQ